MIDVKGLLAAKVLPLLTLVTLALVATPRAHAFEVCPVQSICFSSEVYLVSQRREELRMDLLAKLQKQAGAVTGSGEKTV